MKYTIVVERNEEGFAVSCPGLPGCWSQGQTEDEALENIKDAIQSYMETIEEINKNKDLRYIEVG